MLGDATCFFVVVAHPDNNMSLHHFGDAANKRGFPTIYTTHTNVGQNKHMIILFREIRIAE